MKIYDFAEPGLTHVIDVGKTKPIKQHQHSISTHMQQDMNKEIDRLLALGIIEPAPNAQWRNPVFAIWKSNGGIRLLLDARKLNEHTIKYINGPQNVIRILSMIRGSLYLSSIDIADGYYNIKIDENSEDLTAFTVSGKGIFRYARMTNVLTNASHTFCNDMEKFAKTMEFSKNQN